MPVRLNSSGGGSVTLDVPATAGAFTVNLPAANGDVVVTGGSSTVQFGAGSVSAPSITFSGDTNTGIYSPAADTIAFTEGGVEAMRLTAVGNVGIGTSSPASRLDVGGITRIGDPTGSTVVTIDPVTTVGVTAITTQFGGSQLTFGTSGTERARITTGGHLVCGTTNPLVGIGDLTTTTGSGLSPQGWLGACRNDEPSLYLTRNNSNGNLALFYRNATVVGGISVTTTNTSYNTSSDYRLKANVVPLTGAAARVQALKPSRFNFIADPDRTVDGFIAHEAAQVVPEAINGEKDAVDADGKPIYQGIDHSKLVPLLTAALQEALSRIETLEARLAAVEAR